MNVEAQDVLFYLYSPNVTEYREQLAARRITVSALSHPEYMPERRIQD